MSCWYCKKRESEPDQAATFTLYGHAHITDVTSTFAGRNVEYAYRQVEVTVPRCAKCAGVHGTRGCIMGLIAIGTGLAAMIYLMIEADGFWQYVIAFFLGVGAGWVGAGVGWILGQILTLGRARLESYGKQHPEVEALTSAGWTFSKPTATSAMRS